MFNHNASLKHGVTAKQFLLCFCSLGVITTFTVIKLTIHIDPSFSIFYSKMLNTRYFLFKRHIDRASHLRNTCKYLKERGVKMIPYSDLDTMRQIYTTRNASICVVPKSGCSFLKQIIYYLNDPQHLLNYNYLESPHLKHPQAEAKTELAYEYIKMLQKRVFNLTRADVHYTLNFDKVKITEDQFKIGNSLKVIVARNPYSRLYSAYVDKVFVPAFYDIFEAKYSDLVESGVKLTKSTAACKDYVSFEDFLEIIFSQMRYNIGNPHWLPASVLCSACKVEPDIIIKQETYYEDIDFFLSQTAINQTEWETIDSAIAKKGIQTDSIVRGMIQTMYTKGLNSGIECFSKRQIAQRVWEALKFQGQVYEYQKFPSRKFKRHKSFSPANVAKYLLQQMKKMPITTDESRHQRQRSLAMAYRNIKPELIIKIQAFFYYDFMIYDYDFDPPK